MALLKRPTEEKDPEGRMPLREHIRELRNRVLLGILSIVVASILGFVFFDQIWAVLTAPFNDLCNPDTQKGNLTQQCALAASGVGEGLFLNLKVALIAGLVVAAPFWLYQIWAFVAPGLRQREKKWTYIFLGAAVPLFFLGAALAYLVLSKGLSILLGFVPGNVATLPTIDSYLGYVIGMLLVFGVAFELPLFVVILNIAGILTHERLKKSRSWIVFGLFVFAGIATPSTDPIGMLALAVPTVGLFMLAEGIAYLNDRRRARNAVPSEYQDILDDRSSLEDE